MDEAREVLDSLQRHHDSKIGFVVYRCVYGDDEQWIRFMKRITAYVHVSLDYHDEAEEFKNNFAWIVKEDTSTLNGASKTEVVRQFKSWVASAASSWVRPGRLNTNMTKYECCIYVDQAVMAAVMNGAEPTEEEEILNPTAFVKLVHRDYTEPPSTEPEAGESQEGDSADESVGEDSNDDCPRVEGDRRYNVGWMKVSPCSLVPRWYTLLDRGGWWSFYGRPPKIADK